MIVYLVDGTYELFRAYFGAPKTQDGEGREIGAARALLRSLAAFLQSARVTHVGVAFDSVIESFRNGLFAGYKTGEGIDADLFSQFPLAEQVTRALGLTTWPMVEYEADDALATFAARAARDGRVEQVRIASPDKDLCQCVREARVVLYDRKKDSLTDEAGVKSRLGVAPTRVPSLLALVGDSADGIPGIPRWGEKTAATLLAHYASVAAIPDDPGAWPVRVRGAEALAAELRARREEALLYEQLATLRDDVPLAEDVDGVAWRGPDRALLEPLCARLRADDVLRRFA